MIKCQCSKIIQHKTFWNKLDITEHKIKTTCSACHSLQCHHPSLSGSMVCSIHTVLLRALPPSTHSEILHVTEQTKHRYRTHEAALPNTHRRQRPHAHRLQRTAHRLSDHRGFACSSFILLLLGESIYALLSFSLNLSIPFSFLLFCFRLSFCHRLVLGCGTFGSPGAVQSVCSGPVRCPQPGQVGVCSVFRKPFWIFGCVGENTLTVFCPVPVHRIIWLAISEILLLIFLLLLMAFLLIFQHFVLCLVLEGNNSCVCSILVHWSFFSCFAWFNIFPLETIRWEM